MSATATAPAASDAETARKAGRGGIAIAFAKLYFMVTGLAQQIALGNILPGGGYGALSSAMGIASITYNPLIQTGIQGVSRPVAPATPEQQPAVIRTALRLHFLLGMVVALSFFLAAPMVAEAINARYLTTTFRLFSAVLMAYALYGPLIGILNGQQKFVWQAGLDVLAATLRTFGMVGAAFWFARAYDKGDQGAAVGFAASATVMFLVAAALTGFGKPGASSLSMGEHARYVAPLLLGQFILNLLFQADLQLLGAFARDSAVAAGLPAQSADPLVGAYRATQLFGFLPYQLLIAVSFVLFPMLARAREQRDRGAMAEYVRTGVRLAVILAGLAVSVSSGLSEELLRLVFPKQPFDELAGEPMRVLSVGLGFFAIFGILVTVLNSLGGERAAMVLSAAAFGLVAVLCSLLVRGQPFSEALLMRTALATATAHFLATLAAAVLVWRAAGAVAPPLTVMRVVGATALCAWLGSSLPDAGKLGTIFHAAVVAVAYLALLALMRELGRADLAVVRRVVGGRRNAER